MAQRNWHLDNGLGRQHIIGLYHGEESGHVVVHLNNRVLLLDFSVLTNKTYKFFIDQELYELEIQEKANSFDYDLRIDYEAQTQQNLERKAYEQTEKKAYIGSILTAILLFVSLYALFFYLKSLQ